MASEILTPEVLYSSAIHNFEYHLAIHFRTLAGLPRPLSCSASLTKLSSVDGDRNSDYTVVISVMYRLQRIMIIVLKLNLLGLASCWLPLLALTVVGSTVVVRYMHL